MTFDLAKEFKKTPEQEEKEIQGVWLEITGGAKLLIARAGNEEYVKRYNRIPTAVRNMIEQGRVSNENAEPVLAALIADTVLLNWEGLTDDGEEIVYSKDKAIEMIVKYPNFFTLVWDLATEQENFAQDEAEEDSKNSQSFSDGT